jgi:hypothetical protein
MKEFTTKRHPFASAPRQIGIPYRINCFSEKQLFERINQHNGKRRKLYCSIYNINEEGNFNNVIVDSIPFDLDSEKSLENLRKFYEYCEKKNYKSMYMFSTGGFWAFIKTKDGKNLQFRKNALMESQKHIAREMGLTIGQSKESDIDTAIVGDIARITRLPNSKDLGRRRFCIILKKEEIYKTYEEICEIAQKPRFEYYYYGENGFDIKAFDKQRVFEIKKRKNLITKNLITNEIKEQVTIKDLKCDTDISFFLPCVKSWLCKPDKGVWKARYFTGVYLSQIGKLIPEAEAICKKYFSKALRTDRLNNNWSHMVFDKTLDKAYKEEKLFPNCNTLISQGLCPCICEKYAEENSPIYYIEEKDE